MAYTWGLLTTSKSWDDPPSRLHGAVAVAQLFPNLDARDGGERITGDRINGLYTLPETNSSPLKIGLPNRKVVFQPSIFRCENVSFREGTTYQWDILGL